MGLHKIDKNQAMLPQSTSVYKDIGYITEDEEDDELLISTTPNNKLGGRRQSRGSYHKRDSLQSLAGCTISDDDSIADDDVISSPTTILNSIKTDDTPHIIEDDTPPSTPSTTTNNYNNNTLLNIDDQVKVVKVDHKHYRMQGKIVKQTRCYSTVQLVEDSEMIRIHHTSLALVSDDDNDVEDKENGHVDQYQCSGSMAVVSDCSDSEEDEEEEEEPEEEEKQDTSRTIGVEQASLSSSTSSNIVNGMRQRNIELLHKVDVLEQSNSRYREEARLVKKENEHFYDRLKCPYCYEVKDEMYVMLPCGHRTCFDCHFIIGSKCPQGCREAVQKVKLYH